MCDDKSVKSCKCNKRFNDSMVAPMSLINALIIALCIENSDKVVDRLETLSQVWDDYQVTNNDEINYLDDNIMNDLKGLKNNV